MSRFRSSHIGREILASRTRRFLPDENEDGQSFGADRAWLYATIVTVGYMVSRGLAKSGSHEPYDDDSRN